MPYSKGYASVKDFGAVGDGVTDDHQAIQDAIDAITPTGGTVFFPRGRYLIGDQLNVSSTYPVNLIGEQFGQHYDKDDDAPALLVGGDMINCLVEYSAPDSSQRGVHGAGIVRGLAFLDPTNPSSNGEPGTRSITAALHLRDFSEGLVEDCVFQWINGSAIRTEFAVMSTIKGCRVRFCGSGANAAIHLAGATLAAATQSFLIEDTRLEVCYSDYYLDAQTTGPDYNQISDIVVRECFFEAATVEYPASNNTFVRMGVQRFLIAGCSFNRVLADAVMIPASGRGQIMGCNFANDAAANRSILVAGARCSVVGNLFEDAGTAHCIEVTGVQNLIADNEFYYSGSVYIEGRGNQFNSNQITNTTATSTGYFLTLGGGGEQAVGNQFQGNGSNPGVGGIIAYGQDLVAANYFDRWTSTNPAIRRESANAEIYGNTFRAGATNYSQSVASTGGVTVDGTKVVGDQQSAIASDSSGAANQGTVNAILDALRAHGLIAT